MKRNPMSVATPHAPTPSRVAPLKRFRTMLGHESFAILAPAPLFKRWVQNTEWLLGRQEQCTSASAAAAMFELHAANNADIEQFITQINLLLEEGREHPDLAVVARAMIVGLAMTLHWSFTLETIESALARC